MIAPFGDCAAPTAGAMFEASTKMISVPEWDGGLD